jgi:hypothetical protein
MSGDGSMMNTIMPSKIEALNARYSPYTVENNIKPQNANTNRTPTMGILINRAVIAFIKPPSGFS